jgi:uncharacterized membrane protein
MRVGRLIRQLTVSPLRKRLMFPRPTIEAIEAAIAASQRMHTGLIRFVVEAGLPTGAALEDTTPRARAWDLFALLGVWDTGGRNGVLIYVLTAERSLEIIADRGIAAQAGAEWEGVCRLMEEHFREGRYRTGGIAAVDAVAGLLARHFPSAPPTPAAAASRPADPLPHQPTLL